ncbi:hypothetical protein SHIRM173S_11244 [Streptomyces hirsutus]
MLDAVRDCVLAVGVRRTTLTDVARRAGVCRMTLYRRCRCPMCARWSATS